jgi:hypothetical protein
VAGLIAFLLALVAFTAVLVATADRRHPTPAPDRTAAIAASAQRIAELHRDLGIDPIYDPSPRAPGAAEAAEQYQPGGYIPASAPPPRVVAGIKGHPIKVYACPQCDWALSADPDLATGVPPALAGQARSEVAEAVGPAERRRQLGFERVRPLIHRRRR